MEKEKEKRKNEEKRGLSGSKGNHNSLTQRGRNVYGTRTYRRGGREEGTDSKNISNVGSGNCEDNALGRVFQSEYG